MSDTRERGGASWEGAPGTQEGYPWFINNQIVPPDNVLPTVDYFGTGPLVDMAENIGADGVRLARAMHPGTYFGPPQPNLDRHLQNAGSFTGDMMHGLKYLATTDPRQSIPEIASSMGPNTEGGFWNLLGAGAGGYGAGRGLAHAGRAGRQRWNQFGDELTQATTGPDRSGLHNPWGPQYNHLFQPATHWTRQWEPGMSPPHGYQQPGGSIGNYDAPVWRGGDGGGGIYGQGAPRYYQTTPTTAWTNRPPIGDWQAPRMPDHQSHLYPGPSQRGITTFQGDAPPPVTPAVWAEMQAQRVLEEHDPFLTPEGSGMRSFDPDRTYGGSGRGRRHFDAGAPVPVVTQFDDSYLPPDQRGTPMPQPKDPSLGVVVSNPDLPHGAFQGESSRIPAQIKQIQDAEIRLREQQAAEAGLPPLHGPGYEIEVPMVPPSQWDSFKKFDDSYLPPDQRGLTPQQAAKADTWESGIDPKDPMAHVSKGYRQYLEDTAGYEARGGGKQPRLSFEEWLNSPMGQGHQYHQRFPAMHPLGWPNKVQPPR